MTNPLGVAKKIKMPFQKDIHIEMFFGEIIRKGHIWLVCMYLNEEHVTIHKP